MMRIKSLWSPGRERLPGRGRKVWVFAGLMAGALIPLLVVQSQAAAYNVFCVGASWSNFDGKTMEEANFPSVVLSTIRDGWPSVPASDKNSDAVGLLDGDKVVYRYQPDVTKKVTCAGTSAAPCVIQDALEIAYETWLTQTFHVSTTVTGSYSPGGVEGGMGGSVAVTAGYAREWGEKKIVKKTITNMVPYKLGDTIQPAGYIEWRVRTGRVTGGYFNTGATCRTGGEQGEQYEWRNDPTGITFSFERNIGEGTTWLLETAPLERTEVYKGQ